MDNSDRAPNPSPSTSVSAKILAYQQAASLERTPSNRSATLKHYFPQSDNGTNAAAGSLTNPDKTASASKQIDTVPGIQSLSVSNGIYVPTLRLELKVEQSNSASINTIKSMMSNLREISTPSILDISNCLDPDGPDSNIKVTDASMQPSFRSPNQNSVSLRQAATISSRTRYQSTCIEDVERLRKISILVRRHTKESMNGLSFSPEKKMSMSIGGFLDTESIDKIEKGKESQVITASLANLPDTLVDVVDKKKHTFDVDTYARMLFDKSAPEVEYTELCQIIGKSDTYSANLLVSFMDLFDFKGDLDEAFRYLCLQVKLSGETQQIDRILFSFSEKYWNSNPQLMEVYRCTDIVYAIVFSLVLLNTDLHVANAASSASSRRMGKEDYIKNTMTLIEQMADTDAKNPIPRFLPTSDEKKWKKNVKALLKTLYGKVKAHQIDIPVPKPAIMPLIIGSKTSINSKESGDRIDSNDSGSNGDLLRRRSIKELNCRDSSKKVRILLFGSMNRKHISEKDNVRAKNRKWIYYHCLFCLNEDGTLEFSLSRAKSSEDLSTTADIPDVIEENLSPGSDLSTFIRLPKKTERETFSILHSLAKEYAVGEYSESRNFVFSLSLNNGSTYLFQCGTAEMVKEWVVAINSWAARKSKEPIRSGVGSDDYGWSFILRGKYQSSADDSSGSVTERGSILKNMAESRKSRIDEWTSPILGHMYSLLSLEDQIISMRKQVHILNVELAEHISFKTAIEIYYDQFESQKKIAMQNWAKKLSYLEFEIEKYATYVLVLEANPLDIALTTLRRPMSLLSISPLEKTTLAHHSSQQDMISNSFNMEKKSPLSASFFGRSFLG